MFKNSGGELTPLGSGQQITVESLNMAALPAPDRAEKLAFEKKAGKLQLAARAAAGAISDASERLDNLKSAVAGTPGSDLQLGQRASELKNRLLDLQEQLNGDTRKRMRQVAVTPSIMNRIQTAYSRSLNSTAPVSGTQKENYEIAAGDFGRFLSDLRRLVETDLAKLESDADSAGIPWTKGRKIPDWKPE